MEPALETDAGPSTSEAHGSLTRAPRASDARAVETIRQRIRAVGIALTAAAVAIQTLAYGANLVLFGGRLERLRLGTLPDGTEWPPFTWMSASATFIAGFAPFLLAMALGERGKRYALVAVVLVCYSLDDFAQIHERVPA